MTAEHKAALAAGRDEGRAVRRYLEALDSHKPRRGPQRTAESIEKRIKAIDSQLGPADPLARIRLIQERLNLTDELATKEEPVDLAALEADFVAVAASYGERKGLSYTAWRQVGVPADVLRRAGVPRTRG